ncbi:outer membrane lipoprotein carrier protein LolA [Magnetovibrio sp.]|uniref:LolA family protein n=1 Tax=Magnetovibrio sp. TaxID=2024836 RepID=UPI002F91C5C9
MSAQPKASPHDTKPEIPGIPNRPFPLKRVVGALLAVAVAFAAAALVLPKSANAKDAIGLNDSQIDSVEQVQTYLNAISTLRARFMQVTNQGNFAQGEFMLSRPGRMRIDYDPPVPVLIVSDGNLVMYKDEELDQISYVPLSTLPASMFIGETVNFFGDDLLITNFEHEKGALRLTLQRSEDPMEGSLTLVFATAPLALKKWSVVDAQGITTTVSLLGPTFGEALNEELFKVENRILPRKQD